MKHAIYGLVAMAIAVTSGGCASTCCGPINDGTLFGNDCGRGCAGSAIDAIFGGGNCTNVGYTSVSPGCTGSALGSDYIGAPIINSPRNLACAGDGYGGYVSDYGGDYNVGYGDGLSDVGVGYRGGVPGGPRMGGLLPQVGCGCAACIGGGPAGAVAGLAVQPVRAAVGGLDHVKRAAANLPQNLQNGCVNGTRGQVMGPTQGMVQYPYYTTRGPRDFFMSNPPSIGP